MLGIGIGFISRSVVIDFVIQLRVGPLIGTTLPAGTYVALQLKITAATLDDVPFPLPEDGVAVRVNVEFEVSPGGTVTVSVELNLSAVFPDQG